MEKVKVKKEELLEILRKNRDAHKGVFTEAQGKFRERVIEELDRRLKDAKDGRKIDLRIGLPEPEDHTQDYNRIIKMVEMEVNNIITLPQHEFATYVMDDWQWKRAWVANTLSYTAKG